MTRRGLIIGLTVIGFSLLTAPPAYAQGFMPDCEKTIYEVEGNGTVQCPSGETLCVYPQDYVATTHGQIKSVLVNKVCGFEDFVQLFVNAANYGLAILAALALFFFVWGGFTLLISGGRQEYIENGKKILTGTTIGVIVILTAWAMVGFYVIATTGSTKGFVFPNLPESAPWFGRSENCRERYALEHNQDGCGRNNLHLFCADPVDADTGPIGQLQSLLNERSCNAGTVDGCFSAQTETAWRLFETINQPATTANGVVEEAEWAILLDRINYGDCDAELGCCIESQDMGGGEIYYCQADFPKRVCEAQGKVFQSGDCPSFCSY